MVILQFNKLIRNKWVWGVFAVIVCAAFCFDDFFRSSGPERESSKDPALEAECYDARRLASNPNDRTNRAEELDVYYDAALAFDLAGVTVPDRAVGQALYAQFLSKYADKSEYRQRIKMVYNMDVPRFERAYRRNIQIEQGLRIYQAATMWVSPMELDQVRHDVSDVFKVRVATFDKATLAAGPEKIDDQALQAWHGKNLARVSVPKTFTYKYVDLSQADTNLFARVDGEIRKRVNRENNMFADSEDPAKRQTPSLLDAVAAERNLPVKTAENVAIAPGADLVPGLVSAASAVFAGADVGRLKTIVPSADNCRYALLKDGESKGLWLVEAVAEQPARQLPFDECKTKIYDAALADAREEAYLAAVKKIIDAGVESVLEAGKASEAEIYKNDHADFALVRNLNKGEMSDLVDGKVYVCVDRTTGDYETFAEASRLAYNVAFSSRPMFEAKKWLSANKERLDNPL